MMFARAVFTTTRIGQEGLPAIWGVSSPGCSYLLSHTAGYGNLAVCCGTLPSLERSAQSNVTADQRSQHDANPATSSARRALQRSSVYRQVPPHSLITLLWKQCKHLKLQSPWFVCQYQTATASASLFDDSDSEEDVHSNPVKPTTLQHMDKKENILIPVQQPGVFETDRATVGKEVQGAAAQPTTVECPQGRSIQRAIRQCKTLTQLQHVVKTHGNLFDHVHTSTTLKGIAMLCRLDQEAAQAQAIFKELEPKVWQFVHKYHALSLSRALAALAELQVPHDHALYSALLQQLRQLIGLHPAGVDAGATKQTALSEPQQSHHSNCSTEPRAAASLSLEEICKVMHALGECNIPLEDDLMERLLHVAVGALASCQPTRDALQEVRDLAWAVAVLCPSPQKPSITDLHKDLYDLVATFVIACRNSVKLQTAETVLWSFTKCGYHKPALWDALGQAIEVRRNECYPQRACMFLNLLAASGMQLDFLQVHLTQKVMDSIKELSAEHLMMAADAIIVLEPHDVRSLQTLLMAAAHAVLAEWDIGATVDDQVLSQMYELQLHVNSRMAIDTCLQDVGILDKCKNAWHRCTAGQG